MAPYDNGQQDILISLTRADVRTLFSDISSIKTSVTKLETREEMRGKWQGYIVPAIVSGVMAILASGSMFLLGRLLTNG